MESSTLAFLPLFCIGEKTTTQPLSTARPVLQGCKLLGRGNYSRCLKMRHVGVGEEKLKSKMPYSLLTASGEAESQFLRS